MSVPHQAPVGLGQHSQHLGGYEGPLTSPWLCAEDGNIATELSSQQKCEFGQGTSFTDGK